MEGIVHIRIDERLIHGQVAVFWSNHFKVTRIMVINDEVANDETQKMLLRMVAPVGISTSILTKEKAAKNIKEGKYSGQRVLILVKSPKEIKYLLDNGVDIHEFNVGNMSNKVGTRQITNSVNITSEEEDILRMLIDKGIDISVQMVPDDSVKKLKDIM